MSLPKKLLIAAFICAAIAASVLFCYRLSILRYTAETVIRNVLPDYISVDKISFDLSGSRVSVAGFRIRNAPGFSSAYLLEVGEITCRYRMKGKGIFDGLEIFEPVFKKPVLHIERRVDGRLNFEDMPKIIAKAQGSGRATGKPAAVATVKEAREEARAKGMAAGQAIAMGNRKVSDILKLPGSYDVKGGKFIFLDMMAPGGRHETTLDDISATLALVLNDAYTRLRTVSTTGEGYANGHRDETVKWHVVFDPTAQRLTMSNRFDVSGVEIKSFEPYYDRYSPLIFNSGRFSGTLVFDFDNGNIGSTNEVHLSDLSFSVKPGAENEAFWDTTVPDLVKYFTSASGDVIFDFKIKGDMAKPRFYMGPITKMALTSMVVDKISEALSAAAKAQSSGGGSSSDSKEAAQAKALGNAIKLLMDKKK